jgi:GH35 family endo-1,4-beta-xylanase
VVKEEMLEQVKNLDLLYEKETTSKLLEFKVKYLYSYDHLMRRYSENMVFVDIVNELLRIDEAEENRDLDCLGKKLLFTALLVTAPSLLPGVENIQTQD